MNQNQVNCAVARATGETVERIRQMGFSLITIHSPPASSQRIRRPFHRGQRARFFQKRTLQQAS